MLKRMLALLVLALPPCVTAGPVPLVIGGDKAQQEYPWMAALLEERDGDPTQTCGASLISSRWLITAAHCVDDLDTDVLLAVVLNERDLDDFSEDDVHEVEQFFVHPDYNSSNFDSDIALLELSHPVSLDTASVPDSLRQDQVEVADSNNLELIGWGEKDRHGNEADFLRHVHLDWLDNASCQQKWGNRTTVTENMICAWEPDPPDEAEHGQEACPGDSGGPLFITRAGAPWVTGIVSFGDGNCGYDTDEEPVPGGFTRTINFVGWIEEVTSANGDPLIDITTNFANGEESYQLLGSAFEFSVELRNDSDRNAASDTTLTLDLPDSLSLEETGDGWSCNPQGGNVFVCTTEPDQQLSAGREQTFDLYLTHIGSMQEHLTVTANANANEGDYRQGNRTSAHQLSMVEEIPDKASGSGGNEGEEMVENDSGSHDNGTDLLEMEDWSGSSFPLAFQPLVLLGLLLLYLRRSQRSSHSRS